MLDNQSCDFQGMPRIEIHHGAYIREGHMIAMPLCFPGVTTPIDANDSFITSLIIGPDEIIYGGTSGKHAHIFAAFTRGPTGVVVDLGEYSESTEYIGLAYTKEQLIAGVNGKKGARILSRHIQNIPFADCIQEWKFDISPFKIAIELPEKEKIIDLVSDNNQNGIIGVTDKGLFRWDEETNSIKTYYDIKITRLTKDKDSNIYGIDKTGQIYLINDNKGDIKINLGEKIKGSFEKGIVWCKSNPEDISYLADSDGGIFCINKSGESKKIGQTHLQPVTCMAATNDGRLFGFCGHGIANLFVYEPRKGTVRDLGVAVSVLNRRRYGYEFACAVTNKDGEIYFGENDRGGHLWIYFPNIV